MNQKAVLYYITKNKKVIDFYIDYEDVITALDQYKELDVDGHYDIGIGQADRVLALHRMHFA